MLSRYPRLTTVVTRSGTPSAPQATHRGLDGVQVGAVSGESREQVIAAHAGPGAPGEGPQQRELGRGELHRFAVDQCGRRTHGELVPGDLDRRGPGGELVGGVPHE
jgi:hypothetical protein